MAGGATDGVVDGVADSEADSVADGVLVAGAGVRVGEETPLTLGIGVGVIVAAGVRVCERSPPTAKAGSYGTAAAAGVACINRIMYAPRRKTAFVRALQSRLVTITTFSPGKRSNSLSKILQNWKMDPMFIGPKSSQKPW